MAFPDPAQFSAAFIVKPSSLGDIVHTLPAVHLLKQAHPHLHLRWLCNPEWMPLLQDHPDLDEVMPFPRQEFRGAHGIARFALWAAALNRAPRELPELSLDFQGLLRSALVCQARGSKSIVGLSDAREGAGMLHRHAVPVDASAHAVDRSLEMARALGIPVDKENLDFILPPGTRPALADLPDRYLLLHPFSRGAGKSLSASSIQTLCDCLAPHHIIIVGRSSETFTAHGPHILPLLNRTTLPELLWLARHAQGCISVDSGPMHIASAVNPHVLGIHTWSDPRKVGPYQDQARVWKAGRIAHRNSFDDREAALDQAVADRDARRMADFVLGEWC